jgi:hypothetical protein
LKPFESDREFPSVKGFNLNVISFSDPGFFCGQRMDPTNRRGFLYPFRQNASNVSPDGFITASRHTLANHVKGFFPGYGFPLAVFSGSDSLKRGFQPVCVIELFMGVPALGVSRQACSEMEAQAD